MSKKPTTTAKTWEVQFVQCELDKATKAAVKAWDVKYTATFDGLDSLITEGYKISYSHDNYHDCVGVFMTMPKLDHEHHGYCLTARGPNWLEAAKVLVYKHFTILQANWGTVVNRAAERDEWG